MTLSSEDEEELTLFMFPPRRPAVCHADGHEAGQQITRVQKVPHQTHGPAGVGKLQFTVLSQPITSLYTPSQSETLTAKASGSSHDNDGHSVCF